MKPAVLILLLATAAAVGAVQTTSHNHEVGDSGDTGCEVKTTVYNQHLALVSVASMLGVSLLGAIAPLLLSSFKHSAVDVVIKVGSFAGSGVILATALVHCLLPANEYLTNPCLPEGWHSYEAWAFAFCTGTIILFQILDYYLERIVRHYSTQQQAQQQQGHSDGHAHCHATFSIRAALGKASPAGQDCSKQQQQQQQQEEGEAWEEQHPCIKHSDGCSDLECGGRALIAQPASSSKGGRQLDLAKAFSLALAELAIAFHSIIIGVALGVTPAEQFKTLLIAVSFHQFLEGFALGSAVVDAGCGRAKAYLLALFYSLSTPLGIVIGILVRESFNTNGVGILLMEGILNSVCAGVLVYVVLSGPMNTINSSRSWLQQQGTAVHVLCFAAFVGGAAAMSVIGKWV